MARRLGLLLLLLAGCAGDDAPSGFARDGGLSYQGPITVWNRSQFPLDELRVHQFEGYARARNLLPAPLAPMDAVVVDLPSDGRVTVIRAKVDGGRPWAISTPRAVSAQSNAFVLVVFDDGFLETTYREVRALSGFPFDAPPPYAGEDVDPDAEDAGLTDAGSGVEEVGLGG